MVKKLYEIISEVLNVDPSRISENSGQKDFEEWDSLNALLLVDEIEKEYKINIPIEDVVEINTIKDIKNILKNSGIDISQI